MTDHGFLERGRALALAGGLLLGAGPVAAAPPPPEQNLPSPLGYVSDYAGILPAAWEERIRSVCKDLEEKTGVEMVVVTTRDIAPYERVREYADALYARWRIGTAQEEHGVLLLAYAERGQFSVTLGRNMIRVIPPRTLDEASRRYIDPAFQVGNYGEGLYRAAVTLAAAAQDVRVGQRVHKRPRAAGFWMMLASVVIVFGFFWWISRPDKRHPFRRIQQGEYWGTGQGGFGGNFGGFGGSTSGEKS